MQILDNDRDKTAARRQQLRYALKSRMVLPDNPTQGEKHLWLTVTRACISHLLL